MVAYREVYHHTKYNYYYCIVGTKGAPLTALQLGSPPSFTDDVF